MSTGGKKHVFISHSSRDRDAVERIYTELEAHNIPSFVSLREGDIPVGANWDEEIAKAMDQSVALILIFSRSAGESPYVLSELRMANRRKVKIYPIRLEDIEPSGAAELYIGAAQWVNAFDGNPAVGLAPIIASLRAHFQQREPLPIEPALHRRPRPALPSEPQPRRRPAPRPAPPESESFARLPSRVAPPVHPAPSRPRTPPSLPDESGFSTLIVDLFLGALLLVVSSAAIAAVLTIAYFNGSLFNFTDSVGYLHALAISHFLVSILGIISGIRAMDNELGFDTAAYFLFGFTLLGLNVVLAQYEAFGPRGVAGVTTQAICIIIILLFIFCIVLQFRGRKPRHKEAFYVKYLIVLDAVCVAAYVAWSHVVLGNMVSPLAMWGMAAAVLAVIAAISVYCIATFRSLTTLAVKIDHEMVSRAPGDQ
jgi:hypothetical protein